MEVRFSFEELEIQRAVRKFVKNELLPIRNRIDEKGELPEDVK